MLVELRLQPRETVDRRSAGVYLKQLFSQAHELVRLSFRRKLPHLLRTHASSRLFSRRTALLMQLVKLRSSTDCLQIAFRFKLPRHRNHIVLGVVAVELQNSIVENLVAGVFEIFETNDLSDLRGKRRVVK